MSEPTPREEYPEIIKMSQEERAKFYELLTSYSLHTATLRETVAAMMKWRNAEVLAVLDELENKAIGMEYEARAGIAATHAVPLSAITQLKQRYGGKEQK